MNHKSQRRKNIVRAALAVVLLLDLIFIGLRFRTRASLLEQQKDLEKLSTAVKLLDADVRRAKEIRQRLPQVQRDCDQFFTEELREAASGYSAVEDDLGTLARKAGLRTDRIAYRQREIGNRGVVEIEVATAIEGDYPSVVSFINGLERSKNFYLLDSLTLASSAGGSLRLNLQLKTYFRS